MALANRERKSCESGIYPLEFDPSWPSCAFLGSRFERIHAGGLGHIKRWRSKDGMVFVFREADPEDAHHILQALTTTTPEEVAMAKSKILKNPDPQSNPPPKFTVTARPHRPFFTQEEWEVRNG